MLVLTVQLPVENCWNHLFFQAGYGFGSGKIKADPPAGFTEEKYDLTAFRAGLGFNEFI